MLFAERTATMSMRSQHTWTDRGAAAAISMYQRYLSPYKGYCCAHRVPVRRPFVLAAHPSGGAAAGLVAGPVVRSPAPERLPPRVRGAAGQKVSAGNRAAVRSTAGRSPAARRLGRLLRGSVRPGRMLLLRRAVPVSVMVGRPAVVRCVLSARGRSEGDVCDQNVRRAKGHDCFFWRDEAPCPFFASRILRTYRTSIPASCPDLPAWPTSSAGRPLLGHPNSLLLSEFSSNPCRNARI